MKLQVRRGAALALGRLGLVLAVAAPLAAIFAPVCVHPVREKGGPPRCLINLATMRGPNPHGQLAAFARPHFGTGWIAFTDGHLESVRVPPRADAGLPGRR